MAESPGCIEVDMFPEDVGDPNHPEVVRFRELLEAAAEEYECELVSFEVREGTVAFSFDSDELTARMLKILRNGGDDES
jgi:hypothetical protein